MNVRVEHKISPKNHLSSSCLAVTEQKMQITHNFSPSLSIFLPSLADVPCKRISISEKDRPLINALLTEENTLSPKKRHICNGRFLTMHKRRRKKLMTRSLAFEPAIIDDILHGQVKCILKQVGNWRFNAFTLETVTGGELEIIAFL